jgi:hypothetical protein
LRIDGEIDPDPRGRVVFYPELQQLELVGFRRDYFAFLLLLLGGSPFMARRQLRYEVTLKAHEVRDTPPLGDFLSLPSYNWS